MMKRTLALLLALVIVVGLLPNTLVSAAEAGSDDIYIDRTASFSELEDTETPEEDPGGHDDPLTELPAEDLQFSQTAEKDPVFLVEAPQDDPDYPGETGEEEAGPSDPEPVPEASPELSVLPELSQGSFGQNAQDPDGSISVEDSEEAFATGSGSMGGTVSGGMTQSNLSVAKDLTWYANATGENVDANSAIATLAGYPKFDTPNENGYRVTIMPDPATAADATQLHISLYQLAVSAAAI